MRLRAMQLKWREKLRCNMFSFVNSAQKVADWIWVAHSPDYKAGCSTNFKGTGSLRKRKITDPAAVNSSEVELNFQSILKEDMQEDLRPVIHAILDDKNPKETFYQQIQDIKEVTPDIENMRFKKQMITDLR